MRGEPNDEEFFFCTLFLHTRVKIIPTHTAVADGTVRGERGEQAAGATACERRVWERETKLVLFETVKTVNCQQRGRGARFVEGFKK